MDISAVAELLNDHLVGPEGDIGKCGFFDQPTEGKDQQEIVGFCVRSGWIVDGIEALYPNGEKGTFHGNPNGGSKTEIIIDKDDEIVRIEGIKDYLFYNKKAITQLKFITRKGKCYGTFGTRGGDGQKFVLSIPDGQKITGFCGSVSKDGDGGFLTSLGVILKMDGLDGFDLAGEISEDLQDLLGNI